MAYHLPAFGQNIITSVFIIHNLAEIRQGHEL